MRTTAHALLILGVIPLLLLLTPLALAALGLACLGTLLITTPKDTQ